MNDFEIYNETNYKINKKELKDLLNFALKKENVTNASFDVIFVDNEKIHQINKKYRHIDRPTDVISFALEDNEQIKMPIRVLGDIYISVDKIKEQAKEYGHSEKREMSFLMIHGLLHLLGYDHMKKEDEKIMFKKQEDILDEYGITR